MILPKRLFPQSLCRQSRRFSTTAFIRQSDSRAGYGYLEGVEDVAYYAPGGYCPVAIGDCFRNRYRVLHKLGHGAFSTTWLARDTRLEKYVAVKMATGDSDTNEGRILAQLADCSEPGTMAIPQAMYNFVLKSPNGHHQCLVTEAARCSLAATKEASWIRLYPLQVSRCLAAQLILAVHQVHNLGYVHGG